MDKSVLLSELHPPGLASSPAPLPHEPNRLSLEATCLTSTGNAICIEYGVRIDLLGQIEPRAIDACDSLLGCSAFFELPRSISQICALRLSPHEVVPVARVSLNKSDIWGACLFCAVQGQCLEVEVLVE